MHTIVIRLDPTQFANPNADLRYAIADRLAARSSHLITDGGYDYGPGESPLMFIFLETEDVDRALPQVLDFLATERLFGNDLMQGTVVAVDDEDGYHVIHPTGLDGEFNVP